MQKFYGQTNKQTNRQIDTQTHGQTKLLSFAKAKLNIFFSLAKRLRHENSYRNLRKKVKVEIQKYRSNN